MPLSREAGPSVAPGARCGACWSGEAGETGRIQPAAQCHARVDEGLHVGGRQCVRKAGQGVPV